MDIGTKVLINAGKNTDGSTRLFLYMPKSVIERLCLVPGDEVYVGSIEKTGKNKLRKHITPVMRRKLREQIELEAQK